MYVFFGKNGLHATADMNSAVEHLTWKKEGHWRKLYVDSFILYEHLIEGKSVVAVE